jgi:23S rRNA (adenine-N6)-dimethyltransferase
VSSGRDRAAARARGRHLLRSSALADAIVRDAGVEPGELVVDIGAGSGMVTRALLRAGARVLAVERDTQLASRLRRAAPEARVLEADATALAWPAEPFRVVANLPFAHTTEICRSLLTDPRVPLTALDAIVEWDFAVKRVRVWPSSVLSVIWSAWYELSIVRRIPPQAFVPAPSVAAAVLRARRRANPLVPASQARSYAAFVGRAFRAGRLPRVSPRLGVDRSLRPRDLDARTWAALWQERPRPRVTSSG